MDNQAMSEAIEILISNLTRSKLNNQQHHDSENTNVDPLATMNVFDLLQEFWIMKAAGKLNLSTSLATAAAMAVSPTSLANTASKQTPATSLATAPLSNENTTTGPSNQIIYEFVEKPDPPFVCFVTLPNGSCFATFQTSCTKADARKSAALIALMNSVFNEHPLRRITDEFIAKSIETAHKDMPNACPISVSLYKRMLEMCLNKSMLEFKQMMTIFQLLQWNGSLKAMRERDCTLEDVLTFYRNFKIDESMRYEMSLDWIAREQGQPGLIIAELKQVNAEIEEAALRGLEIRFLKERRDILLLASYQFDMEVNGMC